MNKPEVLFSTVHGSHLYGLADESSDRDVFTVVTRPERDFRWNRQPRVRTTSQTLSQETGTDHLTVDLGTFLLRCAQGVPQYLEAMFALPPFVTVDRIAALRQGFRANSPQVTSTYLRTIKSFIYSAENHADPRAAFKWRRHALRLAWNLKELGATGRFAPTLTRGQALAYNSWARLPETNGMSPERLYAFARGVAWKNLVMETWASSGPSLGVLQ